MSKIPDKRPDSFPIEEPKPSRGWWADADAYLGKKTLAQMAEDAGEPVGHSTMPAKVGRHNEEPLDALDLIAQTLKEKRVLLARTQRQMESATMNGASPFDLAHGAVTLGQIEAVIGALELLQAKAAPEKQ